MVTLSHTVPRVLSLIKLVLSLICYLRSLNAKVVFIYYYRPVSSALKSYYLIYYYRLQYIKQIIKVEVPRKKDL